MNDQKEVMIKMALDAWNGQLSRTDKLFNSLSDDDLKKEAAPGRNSATYLLGHLTAVHDSMFPLMGFGEKLYPQLEEVFIKNPDKSGLEKPAAKDLRNEWKTVNEKLAERINALTPDEWFQKHTSVSEEDFKKEPHRNRLNVLISRTNHLAYHLGQLTFLSK
jgi:uncharacterized damage-inducible protein DinB